MSGALNGNILAATDPALTRRVESLEGCSQADGATQAHLLWRTEQLEARVTILEKAMSALLRDLGKLPPTGAAP